MLGLWWSTLSNFAPRLLYGLSWWDLLPLWALKCSHLRWSWEFWPLNIIMVGIIIIFRRQYYENTFHDKSNKHHFMFWIVSFFYLSVVKLLKLAGKLYPSSKKCELYKEMKWGTCFSYFLLWLVIFLKEAVNFSWLLRVLTVTNPLRLLHIEQVHQGFSNLSSPFEKSVL